jgi:hypothetical protein
MADTKTAGYDASTGEFTPPDGYTLSTTGTWKGNVYLRYASTTAGSDDLVYTLPGMVGKTFTINGAKTVVLDHEQGQYGGLRGRHEVLRLSRPCGYGDDCRQRHV